MKAALGNDHTGLSLKDTILRLLERLGIEVLDHGTNGPAHRYSAPIAELVVSSVI